jgi:hypothetical protein
MDFLAQLVCKEEQLQDEQPHYTVEQIPPDLTKNVPRSSMITSFARIRVHLVLVVTVGLLLYSEQAEEPTVGLEPTTGGLQNRCSAIELRRPMVLSYYIT